nr:uncharacterized protein LOC109166435 [Ipomoea batatas]
MITERNHVLTPARQLRQSDSFENASADENENHAPLPQPQNHRDAFKSRTFKDRTNYDSPSPVKARKESSMSQDELNRLSASSMGSLLLSPSVNSHFDPIEDGVDAHPQQREDRSEEDGPDDDDGGRAVLPAEQTFEERVQVDDDPNGEEQPSEQRTPRLIPAVDGERDSRHYAYQVHYKDRGRRNEERSPLENVELRKLPVFVRCLRGDGEIGVDPS